MADSLFEPRCYIFQESHVYHSTELLSNIHPKPWTFSFKIHLSQIFNKEVFATTRENLNIEHKFIYYWEDRSKME